MAEDLRAATRRAGRNPQRQRQNRRRSRRRVTPSRSSPRKSARAASAKPRKKHSARIEIQETASPTLVRIETKVQRNSGGGLFTRASHAGALHGQGAGVRRSAVLNGQRRHRVHRAEGEHQRRNHQRRHQGARRVRADRRQHDQRRRRLELDVSPRGGRQARMHQRRHRAEAARRTPRRRSPPASTNGGINTEGLNIETDRRIDPPAPRGADERRRPAHRGSKAPTAASESRRAESPRRTVSSPGAARLSRQPALQQPQHRGFRRRQVARLPRRRARARRQRSPASSRPYTRRASPGGCSTCGRPPWCCRAACATDSTALDDVALRLRVGVERVELAQRAARRAPCPPRCGSPSP